MSSEHGGGGGGETPGLMPESEAGELAASVMKDLAGVFAVFSLLLASVGWEEKSGGGGHH